MTDQITFSVDRSKVFDAIAAMDGNYGPLGERRVGLMLGDPSVLDRVGLLGVYGIEVLTPDPTIDLREILASALDEHEQLNGVIKDEKDPHWSVEARRLLGPREI